MSSSDVRRRTELVGVRLTPAELTHAERLAGAAGVTVPALLRRPVEEAGPCVPPPVDACGITRQWREGLWCSACLRSTGVEVEVGYQGRHVATLTGCPVCESGVCAPPRSSRGRRAP